MDSKDLLEVFACEMQCEYKGRQYKARDNGSIMRLPKPCSRLSKWDNVWTFGKKDERTGYMFLAGEIRVHQIICTAFHGPAPFPEMVVDHIDTNRCNNRPENLRWLTRLDNVLNNEYTRKKIIYLYGSIEAFLENPSSLPPNALPPNFRWMRTVTRAEADACKKHFAYFMERQTTKPSGNGLGEWVFQSNNAHNNFPFYSRDDDYPRAELAAFCQKQYSEPMWECRVLNHSEESLFPCSPSLSVESKDVMREYRNLLKFDVDFLISRYYKLVVVEVNVYDGGKKLRVLSKRPTGEKAVWYIFDIWTDGEALFHQKIATFSMLKIDKAYDTFNDISTPGHHLSGPGRSFYCVNENGHIRIKSGSFSSRLYE